MAGEWIECVGVGGCECVCWRGGGSCISHSKETHKTGDNCRNSKLREAGQ